LANPIRLNDRHLVKWAFTLRDHVFHKNNCMLRGVFESEQILTAATTAHGRGEQEVNRRAAN